MPGFMPTASTSRPTKAVVPMSASVDSRDAERPLTFEQSLTFPPWKRCRHSAQFGLLDRYLKLVFRIFEADSVVPSR